MSIGTSEVPLDGVSPGVPGQFYSGEEWATRVLPVPSEMALAIYVNGQEAVTILCTPARLNCLVLGFLYSEGIINSMADVASMRVCADDSLADVKLTNSSYTPPQKRTLTSGCGGGTSFSVKPAPVESDMRVGPLQMLSLMKQMQVHQEIYRVAGAIHCSALCDRDRILVAAEDIGRHNTLDKILGECLLRRVPTRDGIVVTTGRISSEMVLKAARMQTPVVASRGGATDRAISLGQSLGISVVGYARVGRLTVYSCPERLKPSGEGPGGG